ncbi:MAG: SIS domain-containing protein [Spartobacteria bacterium]|nr:SIS domain-containing protein [Spartobacteria bacterium]
MSFSDDFLNESKRVLNELPADGIERMVEVLANVREREGRLFVLGVGGSAAAASHMVNDVRKLNHIEAYTPTDNVSELTARVNDDGWDSCFLEWLKGSRLKAADALFIFSVGGGDLERNISPNLVKALEYARTVGASIVGVVGRQGGYTAQVADACVIIPTVNEAHVTPHTEAFHHIVGHCIVSHPKLKVVATKWESAVAEK